MIRKEAIFKSNEESNLTYHHHHYVLGNIYRFLSSVDEQMATQLHDEGFRTESGHVFKLFNYALDFENANFTNTGIHCKQNTKVKLILSGKKEIVEAIIEGLLVSNNLTIGSRTFELEEIRDNKMVFLSDTTFYKTLSPVVVSTRRETGAIQYVKTYDFKYNENLANNLKRKYQLIYGEDYKGVLNFKVDKFFKNRNRKIRIKNQEIVGREYSIWIDADIKMQKVAYYLGIGSSNSIGCGCLEFVSSMSQNKIA